MHTRYNLLLVTLTSTLPLLPTLTTADLICQSPTSLPTSILQPGTPLTLKFTNKQTSPGSPLLSDVSANLICSSTGDSVLTLATKLNPGKSTSATLTPVQVTFALNACPANSFHVQYEEDSFLSKTIENCQGSFSLQPATKQSQNPKDSSILTPPSISVPVPIPTIPTTTTTTGSATGSPSKVPTTPTAVEPQPTTTGASVPPTTTTIPAITTTTGIPPIIPPNPSSVSTPAAGTTTLKSTTTTTTTTRPQKSGDGGGNGSGGNDNDDNTSPPSPTTPPPNDLASSDMQQSTGSGLSTATIAGISIGILAGVFVILGAILIWRKRSQRRENFDLFYGGTLAAASGFQPGSDGAGASSSAEQPIYGRSPPEEEKYDMNGGAAPSRTLSSNAPRRSRSHTSNHNKSPMPASAPPPLMPMHPLPAAAAGQDTSYYANQQYHQQHQPQHQDYYASQHQHQHQQPPKRKPSYRLPRHHPAFDYESEYEHQYVQR